MTELTPAADRAPLLSIESVSKRFPGVQALRGVSLVVEAGEVHALVGQNGAGKSTLVKCVSGVHAPDEGRILLDGKQINSYSPDRAYSLGIAVVHQRPQLIPWMSVAENVLLGHMPTRGWVAISRREANAVTRSLLERFRLEFDPETPVARLAPAERQQVAIAKALFRKVRLLILDEPTAALDAQQAERLFELVRDLTADGIGVLYVSHHLEELFSLADRVTVLRDGELVATRSVAGLSEDEIVTLMAGRRLSVASSAGIAAADGKPVVLEIEQLVTTFLHGIDLDVHEGEVVGVTGVIGAGGHSIARVAFGVERPASGRLRLRGRPYAPRGPRQATRLGVFLLPEDADRDGLIQGLSVAKNLTLNDLGQVTRHGLLQLRLEQALATRFVHDLSIAASSVDTPVRNLSGGNRQKVLLAKALAAGASLLVLEEPTQGVDVHAKAEIHRILRELAADGKAVLVISTDIRDLLEYVDRVIALRAGRIVGDVPAAEASYAAVLDLTVGAAGAAA